MMKELSKLRQLEREYTSKKLGDKEIKEIRELKSK